MKDSDRILLEGLALVTDATPEQWTLVVKAVEDAGSIASVRGQARAEIQRAVEKTRLLVEKHPGHGDQSVHGGSRGKSGPSAPASSGGAPSGRITADKGLKEVQGNLDQAKSAQRALEDSQTMFTTGGTRDAVIGKHRAAKVALDRAQKQLDLANKMQGSDRGTVQRALREARDSAKEAVKHVDSAWRTIGMIPRGRKQTDFEGSIFNMTDRIDQMLEQGIV